MIRTREERQNLWDGITSGAPLSPQTYGYFSDSGFENQCAFLRRLALSAEDPTDAHHNESLDMRDLWLDGVVGSAQFIEMERKIRFEHWYGLCADIQISGLSADDFRAKVRYSTHLHKDGVKTRKSYLDSRRVPMKAVDYKRKFREAEARIAELESENASLLESLEQVRDLVGSILDG